MRITFILFLAVVFSLQSCDFTEAYFPSEEIITPGEFNSLNDYFNFENVPKDTVWYNPVEPITHVVPGGLTIHIEPGCCGTTPPDSIGLIVRHYPTIRRMMWGNVHTVSNEKMLVTGGAFWWTAITPENSTVTVSPSSARAEVNVATNVGAYRDQMTYYRGTEQAAGNQTVLNWSQVQPAEAGFQGQSNTFVINDLQMGWTNVDALYNYSEDATTQFSVQLNNLTGAAPGETRVFMVASEVPSLMNITNSNDGLFTTYTNSIPVGLNATLIGIAMRVDGSFLVGTLPITVAGDDQFQIDLQPRTYQELVQIVNSVTN
ncbi:MAG: hypothetical protein Q4F57_01385 [Weeksellaceae bacterium]|nr:hypothetical protein [Weeksellaceae bacterium]